MLTGVKCIPLLENTLPLVFSGSLLDVPAERGMDICLMDLIDLKRPFVESCNGLIRQI